MTDYESRREREARRRDQYVCNVVDCCEDMFEGPFDCREMKKCCFRCNPAVVLYSLHHWLTGFVYGVYRPFLFYVLYEQLPANSRFLLLGCLLATEVVVDYASDYLLFVVQRAIKDRRGVLFMANVFDILSCACYFFINEVHWALIFVGAALHSLAASMSIGTHRAIVAWWLVETDSTKYREYFLRHRRRYELLGSFCGVLLGYYVHVHLYDSIFEGIGMLRPLQEGRRHRAVFLVASLVYLLKALVVVLHPAQKFLLSKLDLLESDLGERGHHAGATGQPVTNPVADGAMEGVKSKKEYMERNRRIFQEKIASREVKDDLYNDLGRFWFEDDARTWLMDLSVLCKLLRSTLGYMICTAVPSCFRASPDQDDNRRGGPDAEAETGETGEVRGQVDAELYLPARKLVAVSLIKAVNIHIKDFVQAFVIVYPLVGKHDDGRDSRTTSILLCVIYMLYAVSAYISQSNSKDMRASCAACCGEMYERPWKSRRIVDTALRVISLCLVFTTLVTLADVGVGFVVVYLLHITINSMHDLSSSHFRYMIGKITKKHTMIERGSIDAGVKFLCAVFVCAMSPLFGYIIDDPSTMTKTNGSNFSLVCIPFIRIDPLSTLY